MTVGIYRLYEKMDGKKMDKKYYKIYSKCVTVQKHIQEITKKEAYSIIENEATSNEDYYNINYNFEYDENEEITAESMEGFFSYIATRLYEIFEDMDFIDCGDFRVVTADSLEDVSVQNVCGVSMASYI